MDPQTIGTTPDHAENEYGLPARRAEVDLIGRLFERLPTVLGLNLAVTLGTLVAFAGSKPPLVLGVWLLLMLLSLALRLKSWREFRGARRDPRDPKRAAFWARRFTLGAAATGAAWGLAGVLFYDPGSLPAQIFLPFILAGMVGGSIAVLTAHRPAYMAFCICALVPYTLRLIAEGDVLHLIMAVLVVLYMVGMGVLGRAVSDSLIASLRLAAENQDLVAALREKSALLEATFAHVNQGVAVFESDGRLMTWNPRHRELHGYPIELYCRGTHLSAFLRHDLARTRDSASTAEIDDDLRAMAQLPVPARFEQPGAGGRILEVERNPMPGGGFVATSTDITERKRAEAQMLHLAQHDALTGLPNRLLFHDRLGLAMAHCRRKGGQLAVLLLDLDNFKEVNDAFGHRAGDWALREAAGRLRVALRESDTVARIGGDEFALILPDLPDVDAATLIAGKIAIELERPVELETGAWRPNASLGIALFPNDGESAEQLLQSADLAMYRAKAAGGGFRLFAPAIKRDFDQQQNLQRELAHAIARGQLSLEYQPQLDLPSEHVSGIEALLRWCHPDFGTIDPETLIALAETSGQIATIGEWALAHACAAAAGWPSTGRSLRVAVNVSATQLTRPDLASLVERILVENGLPAERLELELTESSKLEKVDRVAAALGQLHEMGVRLALDDFGTGYASLIHLRRFPLDALKIDRSFIANLADPPDAAIVRSLIELGHRLGLRVIAEGVESEAQLGALRRLGCDAVQGHVVGHPLSASGIVDWLNARASPAAG
jgi:diguanylate cyclase (GGDEF)-like protein/PAS domain S-box-containing protein